MIRSRVAAVFAACCLAVLFVCSPAAVRAAGSEAVQVAGPKTVEEGGQAPGQPFGQASVRTSDQTSGQISSPTTDEESGETPPTRLAPTESELAELAGPDQTVWYGVYMSGLKLGHAKGVTERVGGSKPAFVIVMETDIAFLSMGVEGRLAMTEETRFQAEPPYALVSASMRDSMGRRVVVARKGDGYEATITEAGKTRTERLGGVDYDLADAVTPDLWFQRGPKPGDRIAFRHFDVESRRVVTHELTMREEKRGVVNGVETTWREADFLMRPQNVTGRYVADARGQMLSTTLPGGIELRLEPEDVARRRDMPRDLFVQGLGKVDRPLGKPAEARRLVLTVSGEGVGALADGPRQRVSRNGRTALISLGESVVIGERPGDREKNLGASQLYDPADPEVRALARKAVGNAVDPKEKVARLVAFTQNFIKDVPRPAPVRVREIIADPRGDCTEHAVLFTALARASGVPAREVYGLYYMGDETRAFGGHAWSEVLLDGRWIEVDPTYGQTEPDPFHIRLGAGEEGAAPFLAAYGALNFAVADIQRTGK